MLAGLLFDDFSDLDILLPVDIQQIVHGVARLLDIIFADVHSRYARVERNTILLAVQAGRSDFIIREILCLDLAAQINEGIRIRLQEALGTIVLNQHDIRQSLRRTRV
ncbi:hypothetical protein D3C77_310970 [compost metagenome]